MNSDICKLTEKSGKFVQAHLIPKALTRPREPGLPFMQSGEGTRPVRRWSSWYDDTLVTQSGETILADLDTWAITQFRKHRLVWSGWGPVQALPDIEFIPGTSLGFRQIKNIDTLRLRRFFLSLLWRAAATKRPEFSEIQIPETDLEKLRLMVLQGDAQPLSFYPIQLTQLSTLGPVHNLTPLASTKTIPAIGGPEREVAFFRFYFDGLIAHIHRDPADAEAKHMGPLAIGNESKFIVSTVSYEESFQSKNLHALISDAFLNWTDVLKRL